MKYATTFATNLTPVPAVTALAPADCPWTALEAAFHQAHADERAAMSERIGAGHARASTLPEADQRNWPLICTLPEVAPFVAAEREAQRLSVAATRALVSAFAPDWRAWAVQFNVVREEINDVLNPLAPDSRKEIRKHGDKDFPGTHLAFEIHHYALAAHAGLIGQDVIDRIPKLLLRFATKVGVGLRDTGDALVEEVGFLTLYEGALRLAGHVASPPASTNREFRAVSGLCAILEESDRKFSASAFLSDDKHAAEIAALDDAANDLHNQFIRAPIASNADAVTKLRWVYRGYAAGHTEREPEVLRQLMAYLGADPVEVLKSDQFCDLFDTEDEARPKRPDAEPALLAAE
jgi:hypothetical protein